MPRWVALADILADTEAEDEETPLDVARIADKQEVVKLLMTHAPFKA